jgi:hypothetical protein
VVATQDGVVVDKRLVPTKGPFILLFIRNLLQW